MASVKALAKVSSYDLANFNDFILSSIWVLSTGPQAIRTGNSGPEV